MNPRVRVLFRLLDLRSGGAFSREYQTILRTQWEEPEQLRQLQLDRLKALLRHVEQRVPFYQRRFAEHGVRAADVKDLEDLERIPVLTRTDVVANPDQMLTPEGRRGAIRKATGGSTGERVVFYRDVRSMARN